MKTDFFHEIKKKNIENKNWVLPRYVSSGIPDTPLKANVLSYSTYDGTVFIAKDIDAINAVIEMIDVETQYKPGPKKEEILNNLKEQLREQIDMIKIETGVHIKEAVLLKRELKKQNLPSAIPVVEKIEKILEQPTEYIVKKYPESVSLFEKIISSDSEIYRLKTILFNIYTEKVYDYFLKTFPKIKKNNDFNFLTNLYRSLNLPHHHDIEHLIKTTETKLSNA